MWGSTDAERQAAAASAKAWASAVASAARQRCSSRCWGVWRIFRDVRRASGLSCFRAGRQVRLNRPGCGSRQHGQGDREESLCGRLSQYARSVHAYTGTDRLFPPRNGSRAFRGLCLTVSITSLGGRPSAGAGPAVRRRAAGSNSPSPHTATSGRGQKQPFWPSRGGSSRRRAGVAARSHRGVAPRRRSSGRAASPIARLPAVAA